LMLKRILESTSRYAVAIAKNGMHALEILEQTHPDLIISDVNMPEMDGYELAKAVKENAKTNSIPFVLFAALLHRDDVLRIVDCGADNFLMKSYDESYLLGRVNDIIANSRTRAVQTMRGEDKKEWHGVFDGEIVNLSTSFTKALDMLLSSFSTNVKQAQASHEVAK
jgi:CheY-like chemotaxis protein